MSLVRINVVVGVWYQITVENTPRNSRLNVRKFHLLGSLDDKVKRDLVLSSCGSANDVFRLEIVDGKEGDIVQAVVHR